MFSAISFIFSTIWGIIAGIASVIIYFFGAYGLYTLAKRRMIKNAWFAWIPFLQGYMIGELDNNEVYGIENAKWILLFGSLVISILDMFVWGWITQILTVLLGIFYIGANYKLFMRYRPESATLITILGVFIPLVYPIWYFVIRNDR